MSDRTFPSLPQSLEHSLKAIEMQMERDPGFLLDTRCPYAPGLRDQLRRLLARDSRAERQEEVAAVFSPDQSSDQATDSLLIEIQSAINLMKRITSEMDRDGADTKERMDWLKNYGNLVDRYLGLKEKAQGAKAMYECQRLIIETLQGVLNKDQIFAFKNKLKAAGIEGSDDDVGAE